MGHPVEGPLVPSRGLEGQRCRVLGLEHGGNGEDSCRFPPQDPNAHTVPSVPARGLLVTSPAQGIGGPWPPSLALSLPPELQKPSSTCLERPRRRAACRDGLEAGPGQ